MHTRDPLRKTIYRGARTGYKTLTSGARAQEVSRERELEEGGEKWKRCRAASVWMTSHPPRAVDAGPIAIRRRSCTRRQSSLQNTANSVGAEYSEFSGW